MFKILTWGAFCFTIFPFILAQQDCANYGVNNGSSCLCPIGFGGSSCSDPGCGGTIFDGSQRSLAQPLSTSSSSQAQFSNLTASQCSCESGWAGTGCNVCQSANACQAALKASGRTSTTDAGGLLGGSADQNQTMVCSTIPRVYAASQMSCQVLNPTLQALYPLSSSLNIMRTLQSALTPIPNTTAFGGDGTVYAQLWYDGIEQFYCKADSCSQDLGDGSGSADWTCSNLACTCIPGTSFCGAVPVSNITATIDGLDGQLEISCQAPANGSSSTSCSFKQYVLVSLFGPDGLSLSDCAFGECVVQSVIDTTSGNSTSTDPSSNGKPLGGGVIAGLAVVGGLLGLALLLLIWGLVKQRKARMAGLMDSGHGSSGGIAVQWSNISYAVPKVGAFALRWRSKTKRRDEVFNEGKVVLDGVSGRVEPGQMMAILGPSGAGKTTLVEILAGKHKSGFVTGSVTFPESASRTSSRTTPRIAFVPQQDVLPPTLTVYEALIFAANLRLPESVTPAEKRSRVEDVMKQLGIESIRDTRIGSGERRGISGGEMRRVSIGLELVGKPDVIVLDEPTSGLDSVSAAKVANVLHAVAHDPQNPTAVIASIHQPSSKLYHSFDSVLVLSHGRSLYSGPGGLKPANHFASQGIPPSPEGYNIADYLLDVSSDPPALLFQNPGVEAFAAEQRDSPVGDTALDPDANENEKLVAVGSSSRPVTESKLESGGNGFYEPRRSQGAKSGWTKSSSSQYATTFLTQFQVLAGREWKVLRRDKTLFFTHVAVACVLGVFCGGLYFKTDETIAGFQSRVGCLFFLGALIAFSSLSALYNVVEIRPLFLRERSNDYYSPTAWLFSRLIFDVVPLRIIPTIIVSSITYWMAGLAHDAAHFFKFLFILVLFALTMALFNFLLACVFRNGGIAILLSALTALYQMTFAGFFVHLADIPPVLRWLQWICPLKYCLEALSVNEVGSGLMIQDTLQGVPVDVSASLIMQLLFGFGLNNYYRDVLVLFAFIAGFGVSVIAAVWFNVRERR